MIAREAALRLWLKRLAIRSPLTDDDCATVLGFPGEFADFASSRDVVRLGEVTTRSCLVVDGILARFGQTAEGLRQFTAFYIPGDMCDLHSAVLPRVTAPLQSATGARILRIPHDSLRTAAANSVRLAEAFWRDCVADAQIASEWLLNNGRRDALARLAHLMCELACRYAAIGHTRDRFPLPMTQFHLADATGMTSVHVNRMVRQLRSLGALDIVDREAVVLDWPLLQRLADFSDDYLHLAREE